MTDTMVQKLFNITKRKYLDYQEIYPKKQFKFSFSSQMFGEKELLSLLNEITEKMKQELNVECKIIDKEDNGFQILVNALN